VKVPLVIVGASPTKPGVEVAAALPMSVVPDLVGWPAEGRENLLRWCAATMVVEGLDT
jgi:hypothetical protein